VLRIYPLYWLAIFSASFILDGWQQLHQLSLKTIATYLAFPVVDVPGYIWFIRALVLCYLLAPLLYLLLERLGLKRYLLMIYILGSAFLAVTVYYSRIMDLTHGLGLTSPAVLVYQSIFLGHVILFAAGMGVPLLRRRLKPYAGIATTIAFFIAVWVSMYLVRDPSLLFPRSHIVLFPVFIITIVGFCLAAVTDNRRLPLAKGFVFLGMYSYPLYLFHWHYFALLAMAGFISVGSWRNTPVAIALSPLLLVTCVALQRGSECLVGYFSAMRMRRVEVARAEAE
jgi:peptidoglycan/LPS O-acetylase OafA/YrhL